MQPRISMITLGVRDLARAIEFYEQGLGFPRMDSPPEVAFFTLNGTWIGPHDTGDPGGLPEQPLNLQHRPGNPRPVAPRGDCPMSLIRRSPGPDSASNSKVLLPRNR